MGNGGEERHELALVEYGSRRRGTSVTLSEETSGSKAPEDTVGEPPPPPQSPPRAGEELDVPDVDGGTLSQNGYGASLSLLLPGLRGESKPPGRYGPPAI